MKKTISIIIPAYNESLSFDNFFGSLNRIIKNIMNYNFEFIIINDGSSDDSIEVLKRLSVKDHRIIIIELSRNFGKEAAVTAGLHNCNGDAVIIMDADLQHPPDVIPKFITKYEEGFEIVSSIRTNFIKRSFLKKTASYLFYKLMSRVSEIEMISKTTDFRLLDRKVVDLFRSFTEHNRMVRGIIDWMGFKKAYVEFEAPPRFAGEAVYTYNKLIKLAVNSITSFSLLPLKLAGYLGIAITMVSGLGIILIIIDKMLFNYAGFTFLGFFMMLNTFLIGLVLSCLGLIALYIGNIHAEVVNRPLYIIKNIIRTGRVAKK